MSAAGLNTPTAAAPSVRSREARRARGIFYSPEDVARALVNWAVRAPDDTVFDPSFGGCVFLRAGLAQLQRLGAADAARRVFGTDWDGGAWWDAAQLVRQGADPAQFRRRDFLGVRPAEVGGPFRVVVGNPPYVRPHLLDVAAQRIARAALPDGARLSGLASYWAYFVIHALDFVARGGRLALVLPGALLRADYARAVREVLVHAFGRVAVLALEGRVFTEADEEIVLLLAEDRGGGPGELRVGEIQRDDLDQDIGAAVLVARVLTAAEAAGSWGRALVDPAALELHDRLAARLGRLGDAARVRLGIVTGANRFFLVQGKSCSRWSIEEETLRPVISRTKRLRGLAITPEDAAATPTRLFVPPAQDLPPGAARYVLHGEELGIPRAAKCAERQPWFVPRNVNAPDAFLTSMAWDGPRLALNRAGAVCTNTLLSVYFHAELGAAARAALNVGARSTLTQLSAELEGRACGGGLLKIEPSDASRLVVPAARFNHDEEAHLDGLCRMGRWQEVRALVDSYLVASKLIDTKDLQVLDAALRRARTRRWVRGRSKP